MSVKFDCNDFSHVQFHCSCEVGDLVLLCFAPKYQSYVVFSLNPVLHFLHSDSASGLTSNLNGTF